MYQVVGEVAMDTIFDRVYEKEQKKVPCEECALGQILSVERGRGEGGGGMHGVGRREGLLFKRWDAQRRLLIVARLGIEEVDFLYRSL